MSIYDPKRTNRMHLLLAELSCNAGERLDHLDVNPPSSYCEELAF